MGKRKVTDKDIRSIEFAIDSVFPGASGEAAKQAFHVLVERAEETGKLQNDLNSLRHEFNTLKGEYKKVSHRYSKFRKLCHAMARKEIVDADGERILASALFCMVRMDVHGLFSDRVANVSYLSAG